MLKVVTGYIRIDSEDTMEEISEIINSSTSNVEEEAVDFILVSDVDPNALDKLYRDGYITESDYMETPECDALKFYVD
jgi:hypothetical protein